MRYFLIGDADNATCISRRAFDSDHFIFRIRAIGDRRREKEEPLKGLVNESDDLGGACSMPSTWQCCKSTVSESGCDMPNWHSFEQADPAQQGATDDLGCAATRKVLVAALKNSPHVRVVATCARQPICVSHFVRK